MNPHLLRKFRQRRDVLGVIDIVRGTRTIATCTRATTGTCFDSTGTLQTVAINAVRYDYDPTTLLLKGMLREKTRTNNIRNNTMVGAAVGVPGTKPTNWTYYNPLALNTEIVTVGTSAGVSIIDIRVYGTAAAGGTFNINLEGATQIAAASGQTRITSIFQALVGGSSSNITAFRLLASGRDGSNELESSAVTFTPSATLTRTAAPRTYNNAGTLYSLPYFNAVITAAGAVDFTIRIGMPQEELGESSTSTCTSVIATSGSAVLRSADFFSITGAAFTSLGFGSAGTLVGRWSQANAANGSNQFVIRASDNSYNNQVSFGNSSTGNTAIATASGGVFDGAASSVAAQSNNTFAISACAFAANDLALVKDGAAVRTDGTATIPGSLSRFDIGSDHAGTNDCETVWIQYLGWLPSRATNNTLSGIAA